MIRICKKQFYNVHVYRLGWPLQEGTPGHMWKSQNATFWSVELNECALCGETRLLVLSTSDLSPTSKNNRAKLKPDMCLILGGRRARNLSVSLSLSLSLSPLSLSPLSLSVVSLSRLSLSVSLSRTEAGAHPSKRTLREIVRPLLMRASWPDFEKINHYLFQRTLR